jgi:hypothetical protein
LGKKEKEMKCKTCGSNDVTKSKGKCNECRWVWEQEHADHLSDDMQKAKKKVRMSNIFDFIDDEHSLLEEFKSWWIVNHKKNPESFPLAVAMDNDGIWFEQFQMWKETK